MPIIHVVGLGPGDINGLPMGTYRLLHSNLPVYLRTEVHPVVEELKSNGLSYQSFDYLYETKERFDEVYRQMAELLLREAAEQGEIVYAVPGHPLMAEQSVQNLHHMATEDVEIKIGPGHSFLDSVCSALRFDPIDGMLLLDGTTLAPDQLQLSTHTLIAQVFNPAVASEVKLTLMEVYPDDYSVTVVRAAGVSGLERIQQIPLYDLDRLDFVDHLTTVFVPKAHDESTLHKDPWFVAKLVKRLRDPDGCPWDRKQTHETLRKYVIEEAYEVAHAIDEGDAYALVDELGDLYLQILLHAQIGSEFGDFTLRDVFAALADKLIRRHPHVFGENRAQNAEDAQRVWEAAKAAESTPDPASVLGKLKWGQPAFSFATSVQKKAAGVGFDWPSAEGVFLKVQEELDELKKEFLDKNQKNIEEEFGDVLFSLANLARFCHVDVEAVLGQANRKFVERFTYVEERVLESGQNWGALTSEDLENFWVEAKQRENRRFPERY